MHRSVMRPLESCKLPPVAPRALWRMRTFCTSKNLTSAAHFVSDPPLSPSLVSAVTIPVAAAAAVSLLSSLCSHCSSTRSCLLSLFSAQKCTLKTI